MITSIIFAVAGIFLISLAPDDLSVWYFIMTFSGAICSMVALVFFIDDIITRWTDHTRRLYEAKILPAVLFADSLHGLTNGQTDLVRNYIADRVRIRHGAEYPIQDVEYIGGNVPLEFVLVFIELSRETEPYLFPIRNHTHFGFRTFTNVEQLLTITTNGWIYNGWADKAVGNMSAKLKSNISLDWIWDYYTRVPYPKPYNDEVQ